LGEFLTFWLEESARPTLRPRTYRRYHEIVHLHLVPTLGHITLSKLTPLQVQKLQNEKLASGLSPATVMYILAVLRRALGQAEKWQLVPRNVAKLVDAPRVSREEVQPFTVEEVRGCWRRREVTGYTRCSCWRWR
jgi:site-specific recombinase XerD